MQVSVDPNAPSNDGTTKPAGKVSRGLKRSSDSISRTSSTEDHESFAKTNIPEGLQVAVSMRQKELKILEQESKRAKIQDAVDRMRRNGYDKLPAFAKKFEAMEIWLIEDAFSSMSDVLAGDDILQTPVIGSSSSSSSSSAIGSKANSSSSSSSAKRSVSEDCTFENVFDDEDDDEK